MRSWLLKTQIDDATKCSKEIKSHCISRSLGSRSSPEKTTSRVKILIVIGVAAVGLIASLMAIGAVATSYLNPGKEWPKSPQQQNDEQVLAKRVRELPEVQTFFSIYPNVTIRNDGNSGTSADYFFESYKPTLYLEDRIVLGIGLKRSILAKSQTKKISKQDWKNSTENITILPRFFADLITLKILKGHGFQKGSGINREHYAQMK